MLDLHQHIQALATGTEQSLREAILSLKKFEEHEWPLLRITSFGPWWRRCKNNFVAT